MKNLFTDFGKGFIAGFIAALIVFGVVCVMYFTHIKNNEVLEYAEKQIEIEALREDYNNRDAVEFLEVPGVRRAADGAAAEFERKRNEALQRLRSRPVD